MSVQLYLSTRGSSLDYRFLGRAPDTRWWAEGPYSQLTRFEKPTLLIESPGRAYYSGIPSSRRDRVQTPIRYTLVVEGLQEKDSKQTWWNLTRMWLQERENLGATLDALVSERIEDWLTRSVAREDILPEIMATLESFWLSLQDSALPLPASSEEVALAVSWGGVEDDDNRQALLERFAAHLQATTPQGSEGLLAVLNLAEEEEDLDALLSAHPQKAICLLGRGNAALKKKARRRWLPSLFVVLSSCLGILLLNMNRC